MSQPHSLEDLTSHFTVVSYNGGTQAGFEHLSVGNLFAALPRDRAHCSAEAADAVDLIARFGGDDDDGDACFTLTHLVVRGMRLAESPIKGGVLCVADTLQALRGNDTACLARVASADEFNAVVRADADAALLPCDYFETSSDAAMQHAAPLAAARTGRFIHLKFLTRHFNGGANFDVGTIGLVGFRGAARSLDAAAVAAALAAPVPPELDLCVIEFNARALNAMHADFIQQLQTQACFHLFSEVCGNRRWQPPLRCHRLYALPPKH